MTGIQAVARTCAAVVERRLPHILMGMGTASFAATVVMAVKATPEAARRMQTIDILDDPEIPNTKKAIEVAKNVGPLYIPAALMGAATLACFYGSFGVQAKRHAVLASAYSLMSQTANSYQDAVIEEFGDEVHKRIFGKSSEAWAISDESEQVVDVYDRVTGHSFKASPAMIRRAEGEVLKDLIDEVCVPVNRLYEHLEVEDGCWIGDAIGWEVGRVMPDINFKCKLDNDSKPVLVLQYRTMVINAGIL